MNVDRGKLIQFLMEYFDDEEIIMLCLVEFHQVYNNFARGMGKRQKVLDLIDWCYRHDETGKLLEALRRERNELFQKCFDQQAEPYLAHPPLKPERNARQIFLSHAHENVDFAKRLAADLQAAGWRVWLAPDSIQPGEQWVAAINRGLEESSVFLLVLTSHALASRWVIKETNTAIEMEQEGELRLIPLEVESCQLPALWRSYQRIPFRTHYDDGLGRLLQELAGTKLSFQTESQISNPAQTIPKKQIEAVPSSQGHKPGPENVQIHPVTKALMVRIPAGEFLYGEKKEKVVLPEYWISKTPVTNAEYARFVEDTRQKPPSHWKGRKPPKEIADHPVTHISWDDATAYASWAGCRLPTEQEWEKAARGMDGRLWAWGNEWGRGLCNSTEMGINSTTSVGRFSPQGDSPYGCVDMGGNVWEWTDSWDEKNPTWRVWRGGSFKNMKQSCCVTYKYSDNPRNSFETNVGFRVSRRVSLIYEIRI